VLSFIELTRVKQQQIYAISSFFRPSLQSTKMVKRQTKSGRLQVAKNKKKIRDALHDTDATDDDVDSPCLNDKTPNPPKDPPGTQEMAPDCPDENTDIEKENTETSTAVGSGVAISDNSPFTIDNTTTDDQVDTDGVLNVGDIVNPHINDGDESTVPDEGTDAEGVSNAVIPPKKQSRPMVPEPQVPKQSVKLRPLPQPQLRAHIRTDKSKHPESQST
jgi:hypothetical protein